MAKTKHDIAQSNKVQRDETRKRGGWKDARNASRRNKNARRDFFTKGNDNA